MIAFASILPSVNSDVTFLIASNISATGLYAVVFVKPASVAFSNACSSSFSLEVSLRYAANACSSCGIRLTKSESARV